MSFFNRRRNRFRFTEKTHSRRGMICFGIALLAILIYVIFLWMAFRTAGGLNTYYGSVGVLIMLLTLANAVFAYLSTREEDSYMVFPRLALISSLVSVLLWVGTYVQGFIF